MEPVVPFTATADGGDALLDALRDTVPSGLAPLDPLLAMWGDETNLEVELVNALRAATAPSSACGFELPEPPLGMGLDFGGMQVIYFSAGSETREVPAVPDAASCDGGGYYLDDPIVPQTLRFCPCTCAEASPGRIELRFACVPLSNGY